MIRGCLIFLTLTIVAVIWHSIDYTPKSSSSPTKINTDEKIFFPEQRFLMSGPININTATAEDIEAIPRIGPSLARRIVEFRDARGPLKNIEELLEVKGVGPKILKIIQPYLKITH